jgi:hypothetical protein
MATTAIPHRVARHSELTKDLVRAGRSRTRVTQQNPYVSQLAKDLLSRQGAPRPAFDQVAWLVADLAQRGELEDAEAIGHLYIAIARFEYERTHGRAPLLNIGEVHLAEEQAEAAVEIAEIEMRNNPGSISHYLNYLRCAAAHERRRSQLNELARREVVAANANSP